jgi:ABC-type branched-subunit amino acid transport system substrate-binding protein
MLTRRRFLIASALTTLAGCSGKSGEEPVWVGHVAPLTGPERVLGEHARRGILLAVEEARREKKQPPVYAYHADSRGDPKQSTSEAVRLLSLNHVVALMAAEDAVTVDRIVQGTQAYAAPLLTPAAHTLSGSSGAFSLDVSPEVRGKALARFATEEWKATSAVVMADSRPINTAIATAFAEQWRTGGKSSVQTWIVPAEKLADRLKESGATVLAFAGTAKDFLAVRKSLAGAKSAVKLVFAGEPVEWARLQSSADGAKDVYSATVHVTEKFTDAGKEMLKRYLDRHHEDADVYACQGYEMMNLLTWLLQEKHAPARLREDLGKEESLPALTGALHFEAGHAVRPLYIVLAGEAKALHTF